MLRVFLFPRITEGPSTARLDYNLILEVALVSGDDFSKLPLSMSAHAHRTLLTLRPSLRMKAAAESPALNWNHSAVLREVLIIPEMNTESNKNESQI